LIYADTFATDRSRRPYGDFLVRRIARIYPIFLAALLFTVLRMVLQDPAFLSSAGSLGGVAVNVLLIQAWGMAPSLIIPSWSISTEMAAYLAFPLLLRGTLFCGPLRAFGAAIAAGLLLVTAAALAPMLASPGRGALDIYDGTTPLPLLRCVAGFVLGVLAFRLTRQPSLTAIAGRDWVAAALLGLLALGLAGGVDDLVLYPLFPAIVLACFANRGRFALVLGHGVAYRLGVWWYAIYLLHPDVFRQMEGLALRQGITELSGPGAMAFGAIGFAIVLVLAASAHHLIEVPGRRLVRGWCSGSGHLRATRPSWR